MSLTIKLAFFFTSILFLFFLDQALTPSTPFSGNDFDYFVPRLLEGSFFFKNQGLLPPLYSPRFCAGFPAYANPQSMFYSVPQLLTFIFDPWIAIRISIALYGIIGIIFSYLLCRRVFNLNQSASFIGATIFGMNGFYAMRMTIGHLTFIHFQLLPLLALTLLSKKLSTLSSILITALVTASIIYGGGHYIPVFTFFSLILTILLAFSLSTPPLPFSTVVIRCLGSSIVAASLVASKLAQSVSLMQVLPREASIDVVSYSIGIPMMIQQLFLFGSFGAIQSKLPGLYDFWSERYCGISLVSLVGLYFFCKNYCIANTKGISRRQIIFIMLLFFSVISLCLLSLGRGPLFILFNNIPLLSSFRSGARFISTMILPLAIVAAIGIKERSNRYVIIASILSIFPCLMVWYFKGTLRDNAVTQSNISLPASETRTEDLQVVDISPLTISTLPLELVAFSNKTIIANCHDLRILQSEENPAGLNSTSPLESSENSLNLMKGACLLASTENKCKAFEKIPASEIKDAQALIYYKNPSWSLSKTQSIANILSLVSLIGSIVALCITCCPSVFSSKRGKL